MGKYLVCSIKKTKVQTRSPYGFFSIKEILHMRVYKEARKGIRDNGASFYFCRLKNFAINYLYIIQVFYIYI